MAKTRARLPVALYTNRPDEDPGVVLFTDIRAVFLGLGTDRIASSALVDVLVGLDDGMRAEWRGPHDDWPPRKLSQSELARLLRPFGISPGRYGRRSGDRGARAVAVTTGRNSRRCGRRTAHQPTHRHRRAKRCTCRGGEPPREPTQAAGEAAETLGGAGGAARPARSIRSPRRRGRAASAALRGRAPWRS